MKFATRNFHSFSPHNDYVATLLWEIQSQNLLKITEDKTQKLYRRAYVSRQFAAESHA